MRRIVALLMLVLSFGSMTESVAGVLRDGEVHHESVGAAAAHAARTAGEHGHEDATPSGNHDRHGPEHQHGTASDHCTHAHDVALPPSFAYDLPAKEALLVYAEPVAHTGIRSHPLFRPPKA